MTINCLITDDEPIAQGILEQYVSKVPGLNLAGKCDNALQTLSALQDERIDLLFLDIQMPEISGLDFLKTLKNPPMVIFTTAYQEYALEGYELDVVDYLLKPISFERFLKAMNKVYARMENPVEVPVAPTTETRKDYFFVKADNELVKIKYSELLYVEGLKDYAKMICENRRVITLSTMKAMADLLPAKNFLRIHRSYIINLDKVEAVVGNSFRINDQLIAVGKSYRKTVFEMVKKKIG